MNYEGIRLSHNNNHSQKKIITNFVNLKFYCIFAPENYGSVAQLD